MQNIYSDTNLPIIYVSHSGPPPFFELAAIKKIVDPLKPKIKCIIAMSAHFESNGITKVLKNKVLNTVHDHGFPEYYEFHYSPRGEPQIADLVYKTLIQDGLKASLVDEWGSDHGLWTTLGGIFPDPKEIPVVMISVDTKSGEQNIANIGKSLSKFRQQGCLIIGTGSITHNLRLFFSNEPKQTKAPKIALINEFEKWTDDTIMSLDGKIRISQLLEFRKHPQYKLSHPSDEHWLPIIFTTGAGQTLSISQIWKGQDGPGFSGNCYLFN